MPSLVQVGCSHHPHYRWTSYLMIIIPLACEVHSNLGPSYNVEWKKAFVGNMWACNTTKLQQWPENRFVISNTILQNAIFNSTDCAHKEHFNRMAVKMTLSRGDCVWNSIPTNVMDSESLAVFKKPASSFGSSQHKSVTTNYCLYLSHSIFYPTLMDFYVFCSFM